MNCEDEVREGVVWGELIVLGFRNDCWIFKMGVIK